MKIEPDLPHYLGDLRIKMVCPHCNTFTKITFDAWTAKQTYDRNKMKKVGTLYHCESCLNPIFISWHVQNYGGTMPTVLQPELANIVIPKHDLSYTPGEVSKDFLEALKCYGIGCFNAFAAMCRRTIQQICLQKEIKGSDKVKKQAEKLKEELADTEMSEIIDAVIVAGHDGTHPHLPEVDEDRAGKLLALMNDIIDQIYNRPGRLSDAKKSRQNKINKNKTPSTL